ncbi:MAG: hypothetical protein HY000_13760, partial [Planctomycetes bacterium]|nr:hypothetical protein [Planctomycetota bacterium]
MRRLTIRTKLLAGLVLVLGISAVLTANTLIGLYSYRDSIHAFESKTRELPLGSELWDRVAQLDHPGTPAQMLFEDIGAGFEERIRLVDKALHDYRARLNKTLQRGRDPDAGQAEQELLAQIEEKLTELRGLPPYPYWADDEPWLVDLDLGGERRVNRPLFRQHVAALRSLVKSLPVPTYHDMLSLSADLYA